MSFWNNVKKEWRKPFQGTKSDKEEFLVMIIGFFFAQLAEHVYEDKYGDSLLSSFVVFTLAYLIAVIVYHLVKMAVLKFLGKGRNQDNNE